MCTAKDPREASTNNQQTLAQADVWVRGLPKADFCGTPNLSHHVHHSKPRAFVFLVVKGELICGCLIFHFEQCIEMK